MQTYFNNIRAPSKLAERNKMHLKKANLGSTYTVSQKVTT